MACSASCPTPADGGATHGGRSWTTAAVSSDPLRHGRRERREALRVQPRDTAVDGAPRHEDGGSWNGRRRRHGRCACFRRGLGNGKRGRLSGKACHLPAAGDSRENAIELDISFCTTAICRLPSWIALCALSRFFCDKVCIDFSFIFFFYPQTYMTVEELVYSIDGICFFIHSSCINYSSLSFFWHIRKFLIASKKKK